MTETRRNQMTPDQARSTHPALTAWVGASAGTGKTHVLTARVLRLMLTGTEPENIVCLTFTKAAAAEMKNRIFAELGRWTTLPETDLQAEILSRTDERADADTLARARQLFAQVLDLAGGLQIQTFHSFCQSLLGRFPIEAGMAPGFEGIDESDAIELMASAKDRVLAATREPLAADLQQALDIVAGLVTERTFDEVVDRLSFEAPVLARAVRAYGGITGLVEALYRQLGAEADGSEHTVIEQSCRDKSFDAAGLARLAASLQAGSKTDRQRAEAIQQFLDTPQDKRWRDFSLHRGAFLTKSGSALKTVATKKVLETEPGLADIIEAEQTRILAVEERRLRQRAAAATAALLRLGLEQLRLYRHVKDQRGLVDFDDMIDRTVTLFAQADVAPWILYKLDSRIDHILIDEAQDTNRDQWRVVETLAAEFFAGEGAREIDRTIFAVGDAKQSIFSFQRADPKEFVDARDRIFAKADAVGRRAEKVPLSLSFRSGEAVLALVDNVFSRDSRAHAGLSADGETVSHEFVRSGQAGCVELWPLEVPEISSRTASGASGRADADGWQLPLVQESADDAERRAAWRIAAHIASSVGRRRLAPRGRVAKPGDILVLVRRRTAFVDHLVRALKTRGIPVAGRDRMALLDELPVMDLLALAQFAVLPDDDLTLATVLKSPFVGLDDDDLFQLAYNRPATLWDALRGEPGDGRFADARRFLETVLKRADMTGPFEFFSHVLNEMGGRQKLAGRLGDEIHDPVDELLEEAMRFEFTHSASLVAFIERVRRNNTQIKRDMEQAGDRVRIMTTHSAKGLQAPIVYLSDLVSTPDLSRDGRLLAIKSKSASGPAIPVWASQARGLPEVEEARQMLRDKQLAEYRRLLYVALTRAEDELYIAGWRGPNEPSEDCWYRLIEDGFDRLGAETITVEGSRDVRRFSVPQIKKTSLSDGEDTIPQKGIELPAWAALPMPQEPSPTRPLMPSRPDEEPAVNSPLKQENRRRFRRGNLLHSLLQWLPDLPSDSRQQAAQVYLDGLPDLEDAEKNALWGEVEAIFAHSSLTRLFGPGSRAEVPVAGTVVSADSKISRTVSGQVDRLLITDELIMIIDYKSNRPPPARARDVAPVYLRQMGLYTRVLSAVYPAHKVVAALLWTDGARLMELPPQLMDDALGKIGM